MSIRAEVAEGRLDALGIGGVILLCLFYTLWGAANATDRAFEIQMWTAFAAFLFGAAALVHTLGRGPGAAQPPSRYENGVVKAGVIASMFWGIAGLSGRPRHRAAARVSEPLLFPGFRLDQFWPAAAAAHLGGDLRVRRQCADRHQFLCRAAHLPRAACGRLVALVRVLGLPALHCAGRHGLSARHHRKAANTPSRPGTPISG